MSTFTLQVKNREGLGKEIAKKHRKNGFIPAIVYGAGKNRNILIDEREFLSIYPKLTRASVLNVDLEGVKFEALIKDFQKSYLKNKFIHIDLFELEKGKSIHVTVPLKFLGTPEGVRKGGVLETHLSNIDVACLPKDIVEHFDIDITKLDINNSLHVRDLVLDKKFKVITHEEEVVVTVKGSSSTQEEEAPQAAAQPGAATAAKTETKAQDKGQAKK